ncbi:MAG: hypothetical protein V3R91_07895 [Myxococcota bacterium]
MRFRLLCMLVCTALLGAARTADAQGFCPMADGWELEVRAHLEHCPGELDSDGKVCTFLTHGASNVWQTLAECTGWILTTQSGLRFQSVVRYFDVCIGSAILVQSDVDTISVSDLCR